jgi:hypothetical protein
MRPIRWHRWRRLTRRSSTLCAVAEFPPSHYLEADLAHHIALKQLIDRASATLAVR